MNSRPALVIALVLAFMVANSAVLNVPFTVTIIAAMGFLGWLAVAYEDGHVSGLKNPVGLVTWAIGSLVLVPLVGVKLSWALSASLSVVTTAGLFLWARRATFSVRTLLLVVTAACALLALIVIRMPRSVSKRAIETVGLGMSRDQVRELLGEPNEAWAVMGSGQSAWEYNSGTFGEWSYSVYFGKEGRVIGTRCKHWGVKVDRPASP